MCEGNMALKPMPNDVKLEAKTLNRSPPDTEHDPIQPGRAELSVVVVVVVYVFVFTCC